MRVGSVSNVFHRTQYRRGAEKRQFGYNSGVVNDCVNFRGNFGKIIGGAVGTGAVVAASFFAAPAIICLTGAGLVAGMVAGDVAEDKVNKEGEYKKKKK